MHIAVTGATGFVGKRLCGQLLREGHTVIALSRSAERAKGLLDTGITCLSWGTNDDTAWKSALGSVEAVIHLAGESVAGERWSPEFKRRIHDSRVLPTRALVEAIGQQRTKPSVLLCASAVGYYGDRKDETLTEESLPGSDFLARTCVEWEAEAQRAETFGLRVARMRIGIVLGAGGALEKMLYPLPIPLSPFKLGFGGAMGSGRQWFPWIHLDDVVGIFVYALKTPGLFGPVNLTAPNPVTNAAFAQTLGRVLHRPAFAPIPAFLLRAMVGEFAETLLGGQRVLPTVAQREGYRFRFETLEAALRTLLDSPEPPRSEPPRPA